MALFSRIPIHHDTESKGLNKKGRGWKMYFSITEMCVYLLGIVSVSSAKQYNICINSLKSVINLSYEKARNIQNHTGCKFLTSTKTIVKIWISQVSGLGLYICCFSVELFLTCFYFMYVSA